MAATLRFLHLLALVVWIGGIVFFSFLTAPALFAALPRDMAGRVTAALFPRYYLLGGACGLIAILTLLLQRPRDSGAARRPRVRMLLLFLMLAVTLYAGLVILPETTSLRPQMGADEGSPARAAAELRFAILHRRSVVLNGLVLLCGVAVLAGMARTPAPGAGREPD